MLGLLLSSELMSSSKEFHCVLSAFVGIAMCKIVYDITGVVSPLFFKGYDKLKDAEKIEWNNRGFSTFHAFVVAVASLYLFFWSNLFDEDSHKELIVNRRSTLSDTTLGISIGYFLSDLAMILWNFPALGGMEYVLHHGLSMFSILLSLISGQAQIYILMVLFTESTTPLVNLRWYLDVAGRKNSKLYIYNGVALFLGWLVARILLFIFFFCHMLTHFDQVSQAISYYLGTFTPYPSLLPLFLLRVPNENSSELADLVVFGYWTKVKEVFPLGFYSLLTVPPVLAMMNLFWFWKIAKGMVKTLSKARHLH